MEQCDQEDRGLPLAARAAGPFVLAGMAPGPELARLLATTDPTKVDPGARVDLLLAFERMQSWLAAGQAEVIAALDAEPIFEDGAWTREEVATALRLSACTAQRRVDVARALCTRLPATHALLSTGELSYLHAVVLAEATVDLDPAVAATVERAVLPRATKQTVAELRRSVRHAVLVADPASADTAHQRAVAQRGVQSWVMPDGIAEIRALLDAPDAALVMGTLNTIAGRCAAGDSRGVDARRAVAFVAVFTGGPGNQGGAGGPRASALVQVTVPASALLGLDERPGELAGYGPITAQVARHIAATGTWRRLLTDPVSGQLLDYGRRVYRPPANLAAFVRARDQRCTFPGCAMPASRCDLDHRRPWAHGGTTDPHNVHLLCRRHHMAKDHGPWRIRRNNDGTITWISPTGHTYDVNPPPYDDP